MAFVDGIILAERVPDKFFVHQNPFQIGVAFESDAEHVPNFALEPVRDRPKGNEARHDRIALTDFDFDPEPVIMLERKEMIHHLKARAPIQPKPVHGRQIHEDIHVKFGIVFQEFRDFVQVLAFDIRGFITAVRVDFGDGAGKLILEF